MTRAEAMELVKLYRNWNHGQLSCTLAMHGRRTLEDDALDARRRMLTKAYDLLASGTVCSGTPATLCPHGFVLADNICGPCSEGRPNRKTEGKL